MNTEATNGTGDLSGVMRRIRKLLAIAEDGRGDPNEAIAAAGQAESLMRKFNLDHAAVLAADFKRKAVQFAAVRCSANMKRDDPKRPLLTRVPMWASWLGVRVARLNDCEMRFAFDPAKGGAVVEFCGTIADAEVSGWMFDYLVGELIRGCQRFNKERTRNKAESHSYRMGFVLALCAGLVRMKEAKDAEFAVHSAGRALVLVKDQALVEHFGKFKYRKSNTKMRDAYAANRGRSEGSQVDIARRAVGTTNNSKLRIA